MSGVIELLSEFDKCVEEVKKITGYNHNGPISPPRITNNEIHHICSSRPRRREIKDDNDKEQDEQ